MREIQLWAIVAIGWLAVAMVVGACVTIGVIGVRLW